MTREEYSKASENGRRAKEEGRFSDAVRFCREILQNNPEDSQTWANLAGVYAQASQQKTALALMRRALDLAPNDTRRLNDLIYFLNHFPELEPELIERSKSFEKIIPPPENTSSVIRKKDAKRKLRIGYVSSDVHEHATAFILYPILRAHDARRFEVYLYSRDALKDKFTELLASHVAHFKEVASLSIQNLHEEIQKDQIDILIDLGGHTGGNNLALFARRAAPVQISWFSYMHTTGLQEMDYRFTDDFRITEERLPLYSEKLLHLTDSYTYALPPWIKRTARPLPLTTNGYITFGSFNTSWKINEEVLDLWGLILCSVKESRLLFTVPRGEEYSGWILREFQKRGVDPAKIRTEPIRTFDAFLDLIEEADVALDPFPYSGGATTYHALSRGVPSITLLQKTEYGRNSSAIMNQAKLSMFIAKSKKDYLGIAKECLNKKDFLSKIRSEIPENIGKNSEKLVREVEEKFIEVRKKADHFYI